MLSVRGLRKRYQDLAVLKGLSFELAPGGRLAISGPSGSGKTTLIRLLCGFEAPDEGEILYQDSLLSAANQILVLPHKRPFRAVFQESLLFPHMKVRENILFGLKRNDPREKKLYAELIEVLQIEDLVHKKPETLSGGEMRRVAIARALITQPTYLLLDEPFNHLDQKLRKRIVSYIAESLGPSQGLIVVTHDPWEIEMLAEEVLYLPEGNLSHR